MKTGTRLPIRMIRKRRLQRCRAQLPFDPVGSALDSLCSKTAPFHAIGCEDLHIGLKLLGEGDSEQECDPAARAVSAVRRALCRHQHQHAVGIAMHQPRHRRMSVFAERVGHHVVSLLQLCSGRNDLPPDRASGVVAVHQCSKIRGDVEAEAILRGHAGDFVGRELDDALQLFEGVEAMAHLPAPVVPLVVWNIAPRGA